MTQHQMKPLCPTEAKFQPVMFGRSVDAFYRGKPPQVDDPLVPILLSLKPLKRLARIGFLGALDYLRHPNGRQGHRHRHNRLDHSIGVAYLADIFAEEAHLSDSRRRLLIAASLLHDVGHGPLSHTLEPVFSEALGIDHHAMTRQIVAGDSAFGAEIPDILTDAGVDLDEVLALIERNHDGDVGYLFSGQINLDTLEGIYRCRAFAGPRPAYEMPEHMVRHWARADAEFQFCFDQFWELKHNVYNLFIGAPHGAALDAVAQTYMRFNIASFDVDDFLLDEARLLKRHPQLHKFFQSARFGRTRLNEHVPADWLGQEIELKKRDFSIEKDVDLSARTSINQRYRQTKSARKLTLADLLE